MAAVLRSGLKPDPATFAFTKTCTGRTLTPQPVCSSGEAFKVFWEGLACLFLTSSASPNPHSRSLFLVPQFPVFCPEPSARPAVRATVLWLSFSLREGRSTHEDSPPHFASRCYWTFPRLPRAE